MERIEKIYEFRPDYLISPKYEIELMRYNNGSWIPDDGGFDLAFYDLKNNMFYGVYMPHHSNLLWSYVEYGDWGVYNTDHPNGNAWHYMSIGEDKYYNRDKHPNIIAFDSACKEASKVHGMVNGCRVEFNPLDKTILAGLLRDALTHEVIKPPHILICDICGKGLDWKDIESKPRIYLIGDI